MAALLKEDRLLEGYTPEGNPLKLFTNLGRLGYFSGTNIKARSQEFMASIKSIVSTLPDKAGVKYGET